jgi:hypothetical protein
LTVPAGGAGEGKEARKEGEVPLQEGGELRGKSSDGGIREGVANKFQLDFRGFDITEVGIGVNVIISSF